ELALGILPELGPGAEAAVFTFDDQSRLVQARTSRAEDLRQALARVAMSGRYTALYDALYDASRYVRDAPGTRKAIVLLTDGRDENSALKIEDGLKVAADSHIPVYAVGVGQVDERVLRRIAKLTGGEYYPPGTGTASVLASPRVGGGQADGPHDRRRYGPHRRGPRRPRHRGVSREDDRAARASCPERHAGSRHGARLRGEDVRADVAGAGEGQRHRPQ